MDADRLPSAFTFEPLDETAARAILDWRYPAPYDFYNLSPDHREENLRAFLDPANAYYSLRDSDTGEPVGFCCFGPDARVPGGAYDEPALDIGYGMRPDLTGRGLGHVFLAAILEFATLHLQPEKMRVTIAAFNVRSRRLCESAGFQRVTAFTSARVGGQEFIILTRPA